MVQRVGVSLRRLNGLDGIRKRLTPVVFACMVATSSAAQEASSGDEFRVRDVPHERTLPERPNSLTVGPRAYAERSARVRRVGMGVLGTWSVANMGAGCAGWALAENERMRGFHQMNCMWNGVNAGIAAAGLVDALRPIDPLEARAKGRGLERALLFNAGLDVGYVMAGMWLRERGKRLEDPRLVGWGDALLVQGGFLFTFDVSLLLVHSRSAKD